MKCTVCKEQKEVFKCDACQSTVCKTCMSLTSSEVKVLQLTSRVMKLYCAQCSKVETYLLLQEIIKAKEQLIEDKVEIIHNKDEILALKEEMIDRLKIEVEELKSRLSMGGCGTRYSEAVKKSRTEVVVVKPKKSNQESSTTKQIVEEKINPSTLGVGIARVKYVKEGGLAISCSGKKDIQSVSDTVKQQLGEEYEVEIPLKKNPKIKIFNVDKKLIEDTEEFLEKIITQNAITTPLPKRVMKVVGHYEDKKKRTNVIMELDPSTYENITKREVLYLGWRTCRYIDHLNVIQCYRCWRFGHMAKDCRKRENTCSKCAGDHKFNDCTSDEETCVNCRFASQVLRIPNIDYRHTAASKKCEAYKRVCEQLRLRVNYPDIYNKNKQ